MRLVLAKSAGFCMGVRRAVEMVLDAPGKYKRPIYTYGPLIHNSQVLALLSEKGISVLEDIPVEGSGTVIVRAHGVPPEARHQLEKAGFDVVDATCPRVIKVQTIIRKYAEKGYDTIIVGDEDHPEVAGLMGYAAGRAHVVGNAEKLKNLPEFDQAIIVAQTTQHVPFFEAVAGWAAAGHPNYRIFNTICDATERRQKEVEQLAKSVDAVIVVGGRHSGNTKRLAQIAAETGKPTYHIETEAELEDKPLESFETIGITAGASTPNWIIKKVFRYVEAAPYTQKRAFRRFVFRCQRALLLTNIYVAVGAGALCYACTKLLGIQHHWPHLFIALLYVLSMHILNHLTGRKADTYNDPERAAFYLKHKHALMILAAAGGAAGLLTAFTLGIAPFLILLVMSLTGLSYNFRFLPGASGKVRYRRIRDIPGSKTILIALAWGVVTVMLPALSELTRISAKIFWVFSWSVGMVFARTAFFDILDMQGDRIVGKETVPILVGEKTARTHLKYLLGGLFFLLPILSGLSILPSLGYLLSLAPLFIWAVITVQGRGAVLPGIHLEFLVESVFSFTGIITLLWRWMLY